MAFWTLDHTFFRKRPSLGGRTFAEAKYHTATRGDGTGSTTC